MKKTTWDDFDVLEVSAREIDALNYNNNRALRNIKKGGYDLNMFGKVVSFLGDSNTVGSGATNYIGYAPMLKRALNYLTNSNNFGFHPQSIGFQVSGKTVQTNENAPTSLIGHQILLAIGDTLECREYPTYDFVFRNKKAKLLCNILDATKSFDIVQKTSANVEIKRTTVTLDANGLSNEIEIDVFTYKLVIENTTGSTLTIETYFVYEDLENYTTAIFATGGRDLKDVSERAIDKWFDGAEYAIFAMGTNDYDPVLFNEKIDYIIEKYNAQNYTKLIVIEMDAYRNTYDEYSQAIYRLHTSCKSSQFISVPKILTCNYTYANNQYLLDSDMLDDAVHYSDNGHEYICNLILNAIGINMPYAEIIKAKNLQRPQLRSGNLISSSWETKTLRYIGDAGKVVMSNGNITINGNALSYGGLDLVGSYKYDITNLTTAEKSAFALTTTAFNFTGMDGSEDFMFVTPLSFDYARMMAQKAIFKNSMWVYFSRDVTIKFIRFFPCFTEIYNIYENDNFYIDDTKITVNDTKTITAGWHYVTAYNEVGYEYPKTLNLYDGYIALFRSEIQGTDDLTMLITEPVIEVGGDLLSLIKKA
jgi:hypothetical protein